MRYRSENPNPKQLVFNLQDKVKTRLRKVLAYNPKLTSLPALKQYLTRLDHHYNVRAEEKANEKAEAFYFIFLLFHFCMQAKLMATIVYSTRGS